MSFGPDSGAESSWASYLNSPNLHLGSSGVVRQRCSKNEMRFLSICLLISPYILHTHTHTPQEPLLLSRQFRWSHLCPQKSEKAL